MTVTDIRLSPSKSGLLEHINTLLIALDPIHIATSVVMLGRTEGTPGDYMAVEAKSISADVRLPVMHPFPTAARSQVPAGIQLMIVPRPDVKPALLASTAGLAGVVMGLGQATFLRWYQANVQHILDTFGEDRSGWPPDWAFAWAIRNALSHNQRLLFKNGNTGRVAWRNLDYSAADNGRAIFELDIALGDLLILMTDLEQELPFEISGNMVSK